MVLLSRTIHFNAAHRLFNPGKSEEWNRATYGDSANAAGYGHNYALDVSVAGEADAAVVGREHRQVRRQQAR
jgi:6-pyruvoyltetrahydropterin/6-carboxytetrahydropterin synthase